MSEAAHIVNWVLRGTSAKYHDKNFLKGGLATERGVRIGSIQRQRSLGLKQCFIILDHQNQKDP